MGEIRGTARRLPPPPDYAAVETRGNSSCGDGGFIQATVSFVH